MGIPAILPARATGFVQAPSRRDQTTLETRPRLLGRLIHWINRRLPGGTRRVRRTNGAIRQFIVRQYQSHLESEPLQRIIDDHVISDHPITSEQVHGITRSLQQFLSIQAEAGAGAAPRAANDDGEKSVAVDGDDGEDLPSLEPSPPVHEPRKTSVQLAPVGLVPRNKEGGDEKIPASEGGTPESPVTTSLQKE